MEDLTRKHLRATTHTYKYATSCAHTMKHLCDLWSMYDSAVGAKRCYHDVVAARLPDETNITRTRLRWQHYTTQHTHTHTHEIYHTAKQDSLTTYIDNATVVGLHTQYRRHLHRLQTYGDRWMGYVQQVYDYAIHWSQRQDIQDHAETTRILHTSNDNYSYAGNDHGKTGTPSWGKSRCCRRLKDTKPTGIPTEWEVPCDTEIPTQ